MPTTDIFLQEALDIADRLAAQAVHWRDECNWIHREVQEDPARPPQAIVRSMGPYLYDGVAGLALFLGRAATLSGASTHRRVALAAIQRSLRASTASLGPRADTAAVRGRFGFYTGALGVAWVAKELAVALDEPWLLAEAGALVRRLSRPRDPPAMDDVMSGSAGAIPALLDLQEHDLPEAGSLATQLGSALLARAEGDASSSSWPKVVPAWSQNLTGFSHGASGIGWALATLSAATGSDACRAGALRAFQYEREHFVHETRNWPDFRAPPGGRTGSIACATVWCHGAPGIGLARVLAHPLLGDARLLREAEVARETTQATVDRMVGTAGHNFQLCHGVAGNTETLWLIEEGLERPGAYARACAVGEQAIERYGRAARSEFNDWPTGLPGASDLSLMRGLAGIGHFLLRLHDPVAVPTILVPGRSARETTHVSRATARTLEATA